MVNGPYINDSAGIELLWLYMDIMGDQYSVSCLPTAPPPMLLYEENELADETAQAALNERPTIMKLQ